MGGVVDSVFGGGESSQTSTATSAPWGPLQPYLLGDKSKKIAGLYPEAETAYDKMMKTGYIGLNPTQNRAISSATGLLSSSPVSSMYERGLSSANKALTGGFDPNLGQVRDVEAMQNNPWLEQQFQGVINKSNQLFGDATSDANRAWTDQIAPGIRTGAQSAGQYGSSRQGIAEGVAQSRLDEGLNRYARDLSTAAMDAGANLYGNAYAQDMNRALEASKANSTLDLSRNQLEMQRANQALQNRLTGLGIGGGVSDLLGGNTQNILGLQGLLQSDLEGKRDYPYEALSKYASIINPSLGAGGQTTSSTPMYENKSAGLLGGALGGAQLAGLLGAGSAGTAGGAALGALLMSDRRTKKDIKKVGVLNNGLNVYTFRYKHGGPVQMGVMADEAKEINPRAVQNINGIDYVNYGVL